MTSNVPPAKRILLMCDYHPDPIWTEDGSAMIELESLPLSEAMKTQVREWASWHDRLGPDEAVWRAEVERDFDAEGRRLWQLAADELAPHHVVGYFDERTGRRLWA